ncbi:MAG: MaoC family dehydratase N-terminal domain-containing protein [Chloroflexi bacterium]|nr:MaoC family dehydratase N-terminal domain-containing protein [Chloroflexota bacterium]
MAQLFYEDHKIGTRLMSRARTIFDHDIGAFVGVSGMFEQLFVNREYYENQSIYGKHIAPGLLVLSIAEGLCIQEGWLHETGLAFLGLDEFRISKPVATGDTVHVELEVVEARETKRADRGIVKTRHEVKNQHGETVMSFYATRMIKRRDA